MPAFQSLHTLATSSFKYGWTVSSVTPGLKWSYAMIFTGEFLWFEDRSANLVLTRTSTHQMVRLSESSAVNNLPKFVNCPVELSLTLISGKWKPVLLAHLKEGPLRYGELRKLVPRLSDKMLTQRLVELQALGFITRISERGTGGTYRLSEKGETLRPVLQSLYDWGELQARKRGISIMDVTARINSTERAVPSALPGV